jgi:hypothetical protein
MNRSALLKRKFEFRNSCIGFEYDQTLNFHFLAKFLTLKASTKEEQ